MITEIKNIEKDLEFIKNIYLKLLKILPSFDITDKKIFENAKRKIEKHNFEIK